MKSPWEYRQEHDIYEAQWKARHCDKHLRQERPCEVCSVERDLRDAQKQLVAYWNMYEGCPCGANFWTPESNPHVDGCPTALAGGK